LGDVAVFAKTRQVGLAAGLNEAKLDSIESITAGQLPVWRYTVMGTSKRGHQSSWT
jgi:hypothetical protein